MRGPATLTDELTQARSAEFVRGAGYVAVHTREFPGYHCGNMLVLDRPPAQSRFPEWVGVWGRELGTRPEVERFLMVWESDLHQPNHLEGYLEGALIPDAATVNTLGVLSELERPNRDITIRPLGSEADWEQLLALTVANTEVQYPGQSAFGRWRAGSHRENCEAGKAVWWGAFAPNGGADEGDRLVGSAGLYESEIWARFADVITHPDHRNRGVCSTLVHAMSHDIRASRPDVTVVMVSTPGSQAERIYHRTGFEPVGLQWEISAPRQALQGPVEP
ncbi:MAG: GNAT family N-acetyltransferase [Planctomycetota bacterium]|jgi:hypothetical protein